MSLWNVNKRKETVWLSAAKIATIYLLLGACWILASDNLLSFLVTDAELNAKLQTYKGSFYVFATAVLLFFLVKRQLGTLHRAKRYNRALFEESSIGLALSRLTGEFVDVNPAYANIIGYPIKEVLHLTYWQITPKEYFHDENLQLKALQETGRYGPFEKSYWHKDGHLVSIRQQGVLIEQDGEQLIFSWVEDISERNQIEQELRENEKNLAQAQKIALLGSWKLDFDQDKLSWSDEIYRIFELDPKKFVPSYQAFLNVIHPEDRDRVNTAYTESVENRTLYDIEHRLLMDDGRIKHVHERCETSYDEQGNATQSIGTVLDITEKKRTAQAIKEIALGATLKTGEGFFQQLVLQLAKFFGTDTIFIGLLDKEKNKTIETIALCQQGEIIENISYLLEGAPCADVVSNQICLYPENVQKFFPKDHLLKEMNVQGYIGIPMLDSLGAVLGLIVVLDTKPIKDTAYVTEILEIFSTRAAAEIERKNYEDKINSSGQHLKLYREQAPIASIEWNTDFKVVNWNIAAEKIFGYSQDEIKEIDVLEQLIPAHERPKVQQAWHHMVETQEKGVTINENITKSGHVILCEWHGTPLVNQSGEITGVATVVMDITAEQRALKALVKKEEEQREILNTMTDAVITIDDSGDIKTFNRAAEHIFGYQAQTVLGKKVDMLFSAQNPQSYQTFVEYCIEEGLSGETNIETEFYGLKQGEQVFPIRVSIAELPQTAAGKRRFIISIHDLTLFKRQEEQLNRAQKMDALGKLTGGIAHDFNNMLGVILGYGELLSNKLASDDKLANYLGQIIRAGERGAELTRKLLAYSRQLPTQIERVNINTLLESNTDLLRKTLTAAIEVKLELNEGLWFVKIDASSFDDMVLNMAINAKHAMPDGGELKLTTTNESLSAIDAKKLNLVAGDYVCLSIQDTGVGMDTDTRKRIFEPFFTTKKGEGTGLGLSQIYSFLRACQGAIDVYSEPGIGTRFKLYFPRDLIPEQVAKNHIDTDCPNVRGDETILIVDDEEALCIFAKEILREQGYRVMTAQSAMQALEILAGNHVDLMLTDIIMPKMSGYQLVNQVKMSYPELAVLFASGFTGESASDSEKNSYNVKVINKPYNAKALLNEVRRELDVYGDSHKGTINEKGVALEESNPAVQAPAEASRPHSELITWCDNMGIDGGVLDQDHKKLIDALNQCHLLQYQDEIHQPLMQIIESLRLHTHYHFKREETIMKACEYPHFQNHCSVHQMLVRKLESMVESDYGDEHQLCRWLISYLTDWLLNHILVMDKAIEPYLQSRKRQVDQALAELDQE